MTVDPRSLRPSHSFPPQVIQEIHRAADQGVYEIRGFGAKRQLPHFRRPGVAGRVAFALSARRLSRAVRHQDRARYALREEADRAGDPDHHRRHELRRAVGANVKEAIGRAATAMGTSTTTGDGGMTPEERLSSKTLVYQCLPSRYGFEPR